MRDALARRRELRRRHQVDVEQPIAVVVEQRDAAAGRFEDVILGRAAAIHLPRQLRTDLEGHRYWRAVVGYRARSRGAGPIAEAWPPDAGSFGLRLAEAALEREATSDVGLELRSRLVEEREGGADRGRDASSVCRCERGQLSCGTTQVVSQRRIQNCRRGAQCVEIAARGLERASNLIGRRLSARRLLQLVARVALCLQKLRALLRVQACLRRGRLLRGRRRHERADRTERRRAGEHDRARADPTSLHVHGRRSARMITLALRSCETASERHAGDDLQRSRRRDPADGSEPVPLHQVPLRIVAGGW